MAKKLIKKQRPSIWMMRILQDTRRGYLRIPAFVQAATNAIPHFSHKKPNRVSLACTNAEDKYRCWLDYSIKRFAHGMQ